ncbi:hypothetical protein ABZ063_24730, partial [Streptomyces sp. NPDC006333]
MSAESAGTIALPSGEEIAALGQGTWYLGEEPARREQEIAALRLGRGRGWELAAPRRGLESFQADHASGRSAAHQP